MKILRINSNREVQENIERIVIEIDDKKYTITPRFGKLNIHSHQDDIAVYPGCANELDIDSTNDL
jgi:hypothetical protein